ncbi:MAG: phosphatidic acid phosphatase [Lachnospiraceae bacterium]|nr:phosphatidic acid phosphatase [Lachnospiraceae bacterium]MBQ3968506.1 phosphatidic acid phosphatase [Lachnospiraceae bacterium]
MKKIIEKIEEIVPKYSWIYLIAAVTINGISYFGLRLLITPSKYYDLSMPLDHKLPLLPVFIIPYFLAFAQWVVGYIIIARESKAVCSRIMTGEIIAKIFCFFFFLFLPTTISYRPDKVLGDDILSWMTSWLFRIDAPTNLFPSIHCLESYVVVRGALSCKKVGKPYIIIMAIFSVFVFASTVLLKQHFIVDFFGAVAVAEAGMFLARFVPFVKKAQEV